MVRETFPVAGWWSLGESGSMAFYKLIRALQIR